MDESGLSQNQKILLTIRNLKTKIKQLESAQSGLIAVIGLGCRFPGGVTGPESFWKLLTAGIDAIQEVPEDRWNINEYFDPTPGTQGKMYSRWGGFLDAVDQFDPVFFGISPREASGIDPQQRLLLEVAWETMEHAGQNPRSLSGTKAGVFVGITANDYAVQQIKSGDAGKIDAYFGTGNALNAAAGRIAYTFGLQGPCMSIDTACSSSLVSLHLACQSLRNQESDLALAGGVNLILTPESTITTSQAKMLSPTGRCKTFDESADGYVRGEGCGLVMLKRLEDAKNGRDRILAVIRGSAVNQDGQSAGFTVPNGLAQQALIKDALANAQLNPANIDYIEAHGTGTSLGDPIEVNALNEVFGKDRPEADALMIGSVKTNIGHLESASGIAGFIKVLLALQNGQIPAHLHLNTINPHIPIEQMPLTICSKEVAWEPGEKSRRAGISSFGFSGTNAHIILEEAPKESVGKSRDHLPCHLFTLSAKSPAALKNLANNYERQLTEYPDLQVDDLCYTSTYGRAHFPHRLAIRAKSIAGIVKELQAFGSGKRSSRLYVNSEISESQPKTAFLFTGQGSQFTEMGKQLYQTQPVFRFWMDKCEELLEVHLEKSLLSVIYGKNAYLLHQTVYTQPILFSLEYSLFQLWKSWGVLPDAVAGHSVGEYVAACAAGVFSLEDALKLISARGRLMQSLPEGGGMMAVMNGEEQVSQFIKSYPNELAIASVNAPQGTVISGDLNRIESIKEKMDAASIKTHLLTVSHAFHSPLMDPILGSFRSIAEELTYKTPEIPLISNLSGKVVNSVDAEHWTQHVREAVRFFDGMKTLSELGYTRFIELGPNPVLLGLGMQCLPKESPRWIATLRRGREDWEQLLESLAILYTEGVELNWQGFYEGYQGFRPLPLPTYPFERKRYWSSSPSLWQLLKQSGNTYAKDNLGTVAPKNNKVREELLNELCFGFFCNVLVQTGLFAQSNELYSLDDISQGLSLKAEYRQLLQRWLEGLVLHKSFKKSGDQYYVTTPLKLQAIEPILDEATGPFEHSMPLISLVKGCGEKLGDALRGKQDPLELLFPNGSFSPLENLYQHTEFSTYFNGIIQTVVKRISHAQSSDTVIRILEIGAGTGSTTASVLPVIQDRPVTYHFTDISDIFLQKAKRKFSEYSCLNYTKLDIGLDVGPQGFSEGEYDIIIAANVLHATKHLDDSLHQVSSLLAPGGYLLLWEITRDSSWFDITFGLVLQELSETDYRKGKPFISPAEWQDLLQQHGFKQSTSFPPESDQANTIGQHVVLAQASTSKSGPPAFSVKSRRAPDSTISTPTEHPLLGQQLSSAHPIFQSEISPSMLDLLADHVVFGKMVCPLAAFLEMSFGALAKAFIGGSITLKNIQLLDPLVFEEESSTKTLQLILTPDQTNSFALGIYSEISENHKELPTWQKHLTAHGQVSQTVSLEDGKDRLQVLQNTCSEVMDVTSLYSDFNSRGLTYASSFQGIRQLWRGENQALARVSLQLEKSNQNERYHVHPGLLDSCFQVLAAALDKSVLEEKDQGILMPFLVDKLTLCRQPQEISWCHAVFREPVSETSGIIKGDLNLLNDAGKPILTVEGFSCRWIEKQGFLQAFQPKPDQWFYHIVWEEAPLEASESTITKEKSDNFMVIFADSKGIAADLTNRLQQDQRFSLIVTPDSGFEQKADDLFTIDPLNKDHYGELFKHLSENKRQCTDIVYLWGSEFMMAEDMDSDSLSQAQAKICQALLYLLQALQQLSYEVYPSLFLVTSGVQSIHPFANSSALSGSILGMGRVVANELPALSCRSIDLDPYNTAPACKLMYEIDNRTTQLEHHIAYRHGKRFRSRLVRYDHADQQEKAGQKEVPSAPFHLQVSSPGILDNLEYVPGATHHALKDDEVDIAVHATGVNFRDVMITMGVYPGDNIPLGAECAGVVIKTGSNVTNIKKGDKVIAIAAACYCSTVTTHQDLVIPKPERLSFEEAASVLNVFLSTSYPMLSLAQLKSGDKILIHAASGGVGLAAIQIAKRVGAEIYATAGKEFKRDYLKSLGVQWVGDSRSISFGEELIAEIGEEQIDVVLNSLGSEFTPASLSVLKSGGAFIELGKTEIWSESEIAKLGKNITYYPIALDTLVREQPAMIVSILKQLSQQFENGDYQPLPMQVFSSRDIVDAFRLMQQANHIGKIVISFRDNIFRQRQASIQGDSTYLITGGLSGLGLLVAEWLVKKGAKRLILIGRSAPTDYAKEVISRLETKKIEIIVAAGDVSNWPELKQIFDLHVNSDKELKGVFHCAGLLEDKIIINQEWEGFQKVLAPKVEGTWNLHRLTRHKNLDHFVLFSTISAILGTPGQSNHAAANAFMDALAYYRQGQGLPAVSINWGAWSETGAAARKGTDKEAHTKGLGYISPLQGITAFEQALSIPVPQLVIAPINWQEFFKQYPAGHIPALFSGFSSPTSLEAPAKAPHVVSDILKKYQQATAENRKQVLSDYITARVSEVLGWQDPSSLSTSESFINLGLDSLMAVELKNIVSQDLGRLSLPDTLLFDQPSIDSLCDYLIKKLPLETEPPADMEKHPDRLGEPQPAESEGYIPPSTYPLTQAQKGIWFLYKMNPSMYAFNLTVGLRILSDLNIELLKSTFQDLIARHPILKSTISEKDGVPTQSIAEELEPPLPELDVEGKSDEEIKNLVVQQARIPFDLEKGPLIRIAIFKSTSHCVLLIVVHHIIFDGASTGLLLEELTKIYMSKVKKRPIMLPLPAKSFAEFVAKQNMLLKSAAAGQHWQYWQQKLSGELPNLDLPTDFPRPVVRSYKGAHHSFPIEAKLVDPLYHLCREEDCTLYMLMVAVFQILLHRYSGQDDILTGSPVAGRHFPGFEKTLGHFVNVVVLRADFTTKPSFRDFLKQVKQSVVEALQHQDYPFPLLVDKLKIPRDSSRTPLFQAALAFQSGSLGLQKGYDGKVSDPDSLHGVRYPVADQEGEADLTLEIFEQNRQLDSLLKYNPDLFEHKTVVRMAAHFNTLLTSILDDPNKAVSELKLLTDEEYYQLLVGWQGKKVDFPLDKPISRLFELQAEKTPNTIALECEDTALTYRELNEQANQLAHFLKDANISNQSMIGVFVERSPEWIISCLAILKSDCVYLPLDLNHPEDRIRYLIEDSKTEVVISKKEYGSKLKESGFTGQLIDLSDPDIRHRPTVNSDKTHDPQGLAYIIYTSGSTGKPKGVMIQHPGFVNMIFDQINGFGITATDRCLQFAASSFDVSMYEMFLPLFAGASLVIAPDETVKDGLKLIRYLEDKQVTVAALTASYLRVLDQHPLPSVKTLIVGGEPPDSDDVLFYSSKKNYFNAYGPTEISVCASYYKCSGQMDSQRTIPIGKPVSNSEILILDQSLSLVPIGIQGEICIAGPGLAKGYLNQAELTAAAFVPHPFKKGERLYKTGDLGKWLANGNIEFSGRVDHQVKIRGHRVETREIESVILSQPEIQNTIVLDQKQPSGDIRLVAYITFNTNTNKLTPNELRSAISGFLPDYMIPTTFHEIDHFPMTSSGKIDRKALKPHQASIINSSKKHPENDIQRKLSHIWEHVLGKTGIGLEENFFDLGGDSLLAIQIVSRIYKEFNQELPVSVFFQNQTIEELAEYLQYGVSGSSESSLVPIQPKGNKPPVFCVHGAGGNVMCFKTLSKQMEEERPFLGLQSTAIPLSDRTIPGMAKAYLKEIRSAQNKGPYIIAGWCMGGCIALEIARRLKDQNEEVSLVLIDSFLMRKRQIKLWLTWNRIKSRLTRSKAVSPSDNRQLALGIGFRWQLFQDFVDGLALLNEKPFAYPYNKLGRLDLTDRMTLVTKELNQQRVFSIPIDQERLESEFKEFEANIYALLRYQPQPYEGKTLLIKAAETYQQKGIWKTSDHGFSKITTNLKIKEVPGDHFSILNPPNVEAVSKALGLYLQFKED